MHFNLNTRLLAIGAALLLMTAFIGSSYGQSTSINISPAKQSVRNILRQVESQSNVSFIYSSRLAAIDRVITLGRPTGDVESILQQVTKQVNLQFQWEGNQVVVKEKQTGNVSGTVRTSDGQPASLVTITLRGHLGTQADDRGQFELPGVEAGEHVLTASYVGLQTQRQRIQVTADATTTVAITLNEDAETLQEVIVNGRRVNQPANQASEHAAKLPLTNLENPQVVIAVPKELITQQLVTDFGNILRNGTGIYKIQGNRGINTDGATVYNLRGFRTAASLIDGLPGESNGELDPANVERIEVVKGPSATLYGGAVTSFGGMINVVTKKPADTLGGSFSYLNGSFGLNRLAADVYGPINTQKDLLFRINTAYQYQRTFQDAGFRKTLLVAPALTYRPSERLTLSLNANFLDVEGTSPNVIFLNRTRPFVAHTPDELGFDWTRSYNSNDLVMKSPSVNVVGEVSYQMGSGWTSQTRFSSNARRADGFYVYGFLRGAEADTLVERTLAKLNGHNTSLNIQQNFTGDFLIGSLRNRLVLGIDFLNQTLHNDNSPYIVFDNVSGISADPNYTKINRLAAEAKLATSTGNPAKNYGKNNVYGAYVSNILNITPRLLAMLSLRVDRFDNKGTINQATNELVANSAYAQTAVSPKFGIVYQPWKDKVSLFANYLNGFSNVSPVTQPLPDISGTFKPQQANQWEGGVKAELLDRRISVTASYYDITVDNMTRTEVVVRDEQSYNVTVQDGTQTSRGIEFEMLANPTDGLQLIAGFAHNDSKWVKSAADLQGRRPAASGPSKLANLWVSYTQPSGGLKGVGFGLGGNYIGEHLTANSSITGVFTLPDYVLLNGTVFYDARRFRIGFKLDNLTDQLHFVGQGVLSPQAPRSYSFQFAFNL